MVSTEKVLFSLQMAEESLQEVHLLLKDGKTRSLLNSLYNVYYYGMEAVLLNQDIHCRSHPEVKERFFEKVTRTGILPKQWESEIERIFKIKADNDMGKPVRPEEVQNVIHGGEAFLKTVKKLLLF